MTVTNIAKSLGILQPGQYYSYAEALPWTIGQSFLPGGGACGIIVRLWDKPVAFPCRYCGNVYLYASSGDWCEGCGAPLAESVALGGAIDGRHPQP